MLNAAWLSGGCTKAEEKLDLGVRKVISPESHARGTERAWMKIFCESWRDAVCPLGLWGMISGTTCLLGYSCLLAAGAPVNGHVDMDFATWEKGRWLKAHFPMGEISVWWCHRIGSLIMMPILLHSWWVTPSRAGFSSFSTEKVPLGKGHVQHA